MISAHTSTTTSVDAQPTPAMTPLPAIEARPQAAEDPNHSIQLKDQHASSTANISLLLLVVLAVIFTLHWAKDFFIPLMFGIMMSYALSPIVNRLEKFHIPRAIGAALLLLSIVGGLSSVIYSFSDEAIAMIETLPEATKKFQKTLEQDNDNLTESTIEKVTKATTEILEATKDLPLSTEPEKGVTRVQIDEPKVDILDYFLAGTVRFLSVTGQIVVVFFLAYFLIVSGDSFRRKLIKVSGERISQKRITLHALEDINQQIQRYLLAQIFTSFLVGIATWLAFMAIGVEHAAIWGIAAGILNTIPYIGTVIFTIPVVLVAFMQFETISMALFVAGVAFVITSLEGFLITPWLISRTNQTNAVVIFVGVLFWGWLWGIWGLLLGIPILMAIKAVCDHVEGFKSVGELLGK